MLRVTALMTLRSERPKGVYYVGNGHRNTTWLSPVRSNDNISAVGGITPSLAHARLPGWQPGQASGLHDLRIILFITTHLSELHMQFLQKCWPSAIQNSAILEYVDIFFMTTKQPPKGLLETLFRGRKVTVKIHQNFGKQRGASSAMILALEGQWFAKYDWFIRVNPDVLILEDEWLIQTMHDREVDGIFVDCLHHNCSKHCEKAWVHTDFFAVRPKSIGDKAFSKHRHIENAETLATKAFSGIIGSGHARWLPEADSRKPAKHGPGAWCRVRGGPHVPVLHAHSLLKQCPLKKGEPIDRYLHF